MLGFFNRAIADWNAWESDLKQVLVEAKAEGSMTPTFKRWGSGRR
jgi:hypothetical protein